MSVASAMEQLAPTFTGQLLQPSDPGYDDARRVHNGLIDKRPAIIARCRGTADVADAVKLARTLNLEIAVRGGGHNVGGRGRRRGTMIDLATIREFTSILRGNRPRAGRRPLEGTNRPSADRNDRGAGVDGDCD